MAKSNLEKHLDKLKICPFCSWKTDCKDDASLVELEKRRDKHLVDNHKDKIRPYKL
jgi:hypothetical protein